MTTAEEKAHWENLADQFFGKKPVYEVRDIRQEEVEEYDDQDYYTAYYNYGDLYLQIGGEFTLLHEVDADQLSTSISAEPSEAFCKRIAQLATETELALTHAADPQTFAEKLYLIAVCRIEDEN